MGAHFFTSAVRRLLVDTICGPVGLRFRCCGDVNSGRLRDPSRPPPASPPGPISGSLFDLSWPFRVRRFVEASIGWVVCPSKIYPIPCGGLPAPFGEPGFSRKIAAAASAARCQCTRRSSM